MNKLEVKKLLKDIENGNENPLVWEEYHAILNNVLNNNVEISNEIKGYILCEQHYLNYDDKTLFLPLTLENYLQKKLQSTDIIISINKQGKFIPLMLINEGDYESELYFNNEHISYDYVEFDSFNDALLQIKSWQNYNNTNLYINSFVGCYLRDCGLELTQEIYDIIASFDDILNIRLQYDLVSIFYNSVFKAPGAQGPEVFSQIYMSEFITYLETEL